MNTVEISVIVPIYRIEKYLPQCVDSLLNQSFLDFELILVDDGSPDNCPKICDDYAKKDARIKVIHKENGGLVSARKEGLKSAKGKYVTFVDGDDWVDKFYLDIMFKLADTNKADLVVTGHFREFDGKIETIKPKDVGIYNEKELKSKILPNAIYNGEFCEHGISTYVWNKLFKKDLLDQILFNVPNDVVMGEDAAITFSYLTITKSLVISSTPLYYYRQRHDSIVKSVENPKIEYYRLGLLMNYLQSKLKMSLDENNIKEQITYYLYSQILVRSGGLIYGEDGNQMFNPFLNIEPNSRVVVYSSGSFGQHILSTNIKNNYFKVVNWIDVDYHELKIGDNYVKPISSVSESDYDYLIIATINPSYHKNIKTELSLMGVDEKKIVKINTDFNQVSSLLVQLGFDDEFRFQNN
ncbi:glycosyltransferase family 2 protein [uncultured Maribacter sp.]|uniref:glycosyltransferase family 2 protein n=1 Tax=uncultured Maribacter sp. TaxID=431308 RepID=UPI00261CDFBD|nr:glycosyltransferase family 2 protein [uncultured Maribacter sp.]